MLYFINKKKERIRYKYIKGKSPGIIFIHGLNSDMSGQKASSLERFARKNKYGFICRKQRIYQKRIIKNEWTKR